MRSMLSALSILGFLTLSRAQAPFSIEKQCVGFPDLIKDLFPEEFCLQAEISTCSSLSANISVSYGDTLLYAESVNGMDDIEPYCAETTDLCTTCLELKSVDLSPAHANICYDVAVTCTINMGFNFDIPLRTDERCLQLGTECNALDCGSCLENPGCGWCTDGDGRCEAILDLPGDGPIGKSQPYCSACDESSFWLTPEGAQNEGKTCTDPTGAIFRKQQAELEAEARDGKGLSPTMLALIVISTLFGLLLIAYLRRTCVRKGSLRPAADGGGQYAEPVQLQDDEEDGHGLPRQYNDTAAHGNTDTAY